MSNTTIVIFRKERAGRRECFALFPELPADTAGNSCTAYQQVGQHCAADYHGCIANSHTVSPGEYAALFEELEQRGYHLDVRRRATAVMHERRRGAAMQWQMKREKRT